MQKIILGFGIILLVNACTSNIASTSQPVNSINPQAANCPQSQVLPLAVQNKNEIFDRFEFHIRNIEASADTVKFQTLKQDFVFCRANNSWTVKSGTLRNELKPQSNYAAFAQETVNPKFRKIDFQGNTYQYRVVRKPQFTLGDNNNISRPDVANPAQDQIVFELISPNAKNTQ
jgi:hypothetical protein